MLQIDLMLLTTVNSTLSHPWLNAFFPMITDLHKTPWFKWVIPILIATLLGLRWRKKAFVIFPALLITMGWTDFSASQLIKNNVQRPRPSVVSSSIIQRAPSAGFSFPSNHAANMFALATFVSFFLPTWRLCFFTIAVLVAYSRVYCGVHFPADVIFGAVWGFLWGSLAAKGTAFLISARGRS